MEGVTVEAVQVLLILMPGFVTSWIVLALTVRPSETDFDKLIEALFYSFSIYALLLLARLIDPLPIRMIAITGKGSEGLVADASHLQRFVTYSFISAASLGLLISYLINHDILTSFFRFAGISRKTSRTSIWSDVFNDITGWVVIAFDDGRRVRGWPRYFSDTTDDASVYLERAQWIRADGTGIGNEEQGLLVTKNATIHTISFLNPQPSNDSKRIFIGLVLLLCIPIVVFIYYIVFIL